MEQLKSGNIGAIIAVVVLVLVIVLAVVGQMSLLTAGLFGALAIARLV